MPNQDPQPNNNTNSAYPSRCGASSPNPNGNLTIPELSSQLQRGHVISISDPLAPLVPPSLPKLSMEYLRAQEQDRLFSLRHEQQLTPERNNQIHKAESLAKALQHVVVAQPTYLAALSQGITRYLTNFDRRNKAGWRTHAVAVTGLNGTGKTFTPALAAKHLGIKSSSINLGEFKNDPERLREQLELELETDEPNLVTLDEIHRLCEGGDSSPALELIKSLFEPRFPSNGKRIESFFVITMNPAADVYGELVPHPDDTSVEDILRLHQLHFATPLIAAQQTLSIFPLSFQRILAPRLTMTVPFDRVGFEQLIICAASQALDTIFPTNHQVKPYLTSAFCDYLFNESVIPSEQARGLAQKVEELIFDAARNFQCRLPSELQSVPYRLYFDFKPHQGLITIVGEAQQNGNNGVSAHPLPVILNYQPKLAFTITPIRGRALLRHEFCDAAHEFGHALAALRFGVPFDFLRVDRNTAYGNPFVKTGVEFESLAPGDATSRDTFAYIALLLGSAAMETLLFDGTGHPPTIISQRLSLGAAEDLRQANQHLEGLWLEEGFHPTRGPKQFGSDADHGRGLEPALSEIHAEIQEALSAILLFLIEDFRTAASINDYQNWIEEIARRVKVTEAEFYNIVSCPYHGARQLFHDDQLYHNMSGSVELDQSVVAAASQPYGSTQTTPAQNLDRLIKELMRPVLASATKRKNLS